MTTVVMPTRGRAESEALTRALINLASKGLRPHCSDPGTSELWLSDHPAERREAVKVCAGAPSSLNAGQPPRPATNGGTSGAATTTRVGRKHSERREGTSQSAGLGISGQR